MLEKLKKFLKFGNFDEIDPEKDDVTDLDTPINQEEVDGYYKRDSQMFDERREELEKERARQKAIEKFRRGEID